MVTLTKPYGLYKTGDVVILPADTESSLIAQGWATAAMTTSEPSLTGSPDQPCTVGGNIMPLPQAGQGVPTYYQGPVTVPCIRLGQAALAAYETDGTAPAAAGTMYLTEIFVPATMKATGAGVLNGTTVGTDLMLVALYGTDGTLLANSDVAGEITGTASVMQNRAFIAPVILPKGRYFVGVHSNGTTDTLRHLEVANGAPNCCSATAGTFGTVPTTITPPVTVVDVTGVICQLYS